MKLKIRRVWMAAIILYLPFVFMNNLAHGQTEQQQSPPLVNASPEQTVKEGDLVTLSGSGSFDPDGKIVSYAWGIEDSDDSSPPIVLEGQNTPVATFTAPKVADSVDSNSYLFELTVTDNDGLKDSNTFKVVVTKK
ncbi:MAG: PKD domain-containing protein [Nitrososphaeraceae archaeon]